MKKPKIEYDEELGYTKVTIYYKDKEFFGTASCAPEDAENKSYITGEFIALSRAKVSYLKFVRDCEILPALAAVKELHYSLNTNKNYNEHNLEARRIRKHMYMLESDLKTVQDMIKSEKKELRRYLYYKDKKG